MGRSGRDLLDDLLALSAAVEAAAGREPDASGVAELGARIAAQAAAGAPLTLADLAVDGHDLQRELGLAEGPALGEILERLLEAVVDDPGSNDRATLLRMADGWLAEGWPGPRMG
jgi:poly(A) polymerase/tRNA nucleotidyltransferase (CCA-adding enzyme)